MIRSTADANRIIELVARTIAVPGALASMGYSGSAAVALCPLHANVLAAASFDRRVVLSTRSSSRQYTAAGEIRRLHGFIRGERDRFADADLVPVLVSPEHLVVFVAGGAGTYSAVFCGLSDGVGDAVTTIIETDTEPTNPRSAARMNQPDPQLIVHHVDDLQWHEVRSQQMGDRRASVWNRFVDITDDRTVAYTRATTQGSCCRATHITATK